MGNFLWWERSYSTATGVLELTIHPHAPLTARSFVAYGMGNFLWWERSYSTATGVLELTIHPHAPLTARFIPAVVSGTGQPVPDRGAAARQAVAHYDSLRACTELAPKPS